MEVNCQVNFSSSSIITWSALVKPNFESSLYQSLDSKGEGLYKKVKTKQKSSTIGHGQSHEKIHLTKCSEMIIPKKNNKISYSCLFWNSWRSAILNTVTKLKTKKNILSEKRKNGLKSIMKKKIWEQNIFSIKNSLKKLGFLTEDQGVTQGETY